MRFPRFLLPFLSVVLSLMVAPLAAQGDCPDDNSPKAPTEEQRQEMERIEQAAETMQQLVEVARNSEAAHRAAGQVEAASVWRQIGEAWRAAEKSLRETLLAKVDEYYCIEAPPGTTYEYDPDSRHYAYVPGSSTKDAKKVIFCPATFSENLDLVASVKIHELRHAWQVHDCWTTRPGYWGDCTFWGHLAELDAYAAEERAYDAGATGNMPEAEKELIRERLREHRNSAFPWLSPSFFFDLIHAPPGDTVSLPVGIHNGTNETLVVDVVFTDDQGWPVQPPLVQELVIEPEQQAFVEAEVQIPPGAERGTVNKVTATVLSENGTTPEHPFTESFITVSDPWSIRPVFSPPTGNFASGLPTFLVRNNSFEEVTFLVMFDSLLGWPVANSPVEVTVEAFGEIEVIADVNPPAGALPGEIDILTALLAPADAPSQQSRAITTVELMQVDLAPIGGSAPLLPAVQSGSAIDPSGLIVNVGTSPTGPCGAHFTIAGPNDPDAIIFEGVTNVPATSLENRTAVAPFDPVTMDAAGHYIYTLRITPPPTEPGEVPEGDVDHNPENDVFTTEFVVQGDGDTMGDIWSIHDAGDLMPRED